MHWLGPLWNLTAERESKHLTRGSPGGPHVNSSAVLLMEGAPGVQDGQLKWWWGALLGLGTTSVTRRGITAKLSLEYRIGMYLNVSSDLWNLMWAYWFCLHLKFCDSVHHGFFTLILSFKNIVWNVIYHGPCYELNGTLPPNSYVEVWTPSTSECYIIWK